MVLCKWGSHVNEIWSRLRVYLHVANFILIWFMQQQDEISWVFCNFHLCTHIILVTELKLYNRCCCYIGRWNGNFWCTDVCWKQTDFHFNTFTSFASSDVWTKMNLKENLSWIYTAGEGKILTSTSHFKSCSSIMLTFVLPVYPFAIFTFSIVPDTPCSLPP